MYSLLLVILGFIIGFLIRKILRKKSKYLRKGLYTQEYKITYNDSSLGSFEAVFEVGEIDFTDVHSKVEVISVKSNKSDYNTIKSEKKKLIDMIDNSWIKSSDINWMNSKIKKRNDKIDQVLR